MTFDPKKVEDFTHSDLYSKAEEAIGMVLGYVSYLENSLEQSRCKAFLEAAEIAERSDTPEANQIAQVLRKNAEEVFK